MTVEFKAWPKIPRATGERVTITEKLDGTNACIIIEDGQIVGTQSRKRLIAPSDDNYGFATWVESNREELLGLGEGYHYGEWAGLGIQKNPHNLASKKFFLFNTFRWNANNPNRPKCCEVVPVLYEGEVKPDIFDKAMAALKKLSLEAGYTPEGIVSYYHKTKRYEKLTYNYAAGKWCNS